MLQLVREQRPHFNNDTRITSNVSISKMKLAYYNAFAALYSFAGYCADSVLVNSSWTKNHIESLWNLKESKDFQLCEDSDEEVVEDKIDSRKTSEREQDVNALKEEEEKKSWNDWNCSATFSGRRLALVFPPCNTENLQKVTEPDNTYEEYERIWKEPSLGKVDLDRIVYSSADCDTKDIIASMRGRKLIISVGQFRPEKDHMLQIRSVTVEFLNSVHYMK